MLNRRCSTQPGVTSVLLVLLALGFWIAAASAEPDATAGIKVKFVYEDAVYLASGSSSGLSEGQRLVVRRNENSVELPGMIGEIEIESVAAASAAARIVSSTSEIVPGDIAFLSDDSLQKLRVQQLSKEARKYPQLASFTEGAPPEQETRENLPRPPLPEVNRIRGRIGIDSSILQVPGTGIHSSQFGFLLRLDATRLGNSYWSISGYHRGRFQSTTDYRQQTLSDLINRTYHLSLNYDSPKNNWVAGIGRLYVPWAGSLNTMDGFYLGRRIGKQTVGIFGGTNPDPTSWNYDPDRQTAGAFVSLERGTFESLRITSSSGIGVSRVRWHPDRQFGFFENGIFYKHYLSIYSDLEADLLNASQNNGKRKLTLSRSYFTVRLQPHKRLSFDLSENYFRNIPTFDTRLIGTGLLDKFLFQGLSGGFRIELPYHLGLYGNTGRSSRTGDNRPSWNYLAGAAVSDILRSGIRVDYRYSRFDSSFGRGIYQSVTADRRIGEGLRFDLQFGQQSIASALTAQSRARFINGNLEWYLKSSYFMGLGLTAYRGQSQHYNQYFVSLGYRFDNRRRIND